MSGAPSLTPNANNNQIPNQPQFVNFSSIAPLQPMHDLLYNDLNTNGFDIGTEELETGWSEGAIGGMPGAGQGVGQGVTSGLAGGNGYLFEGDFGNDSFWGFMNNYRP